MSMSYEIPPCYYAPPYTGRKYFLTSDERRASGSSCFLEFQRGKYSGAWQEDSLCIYDDICLASGLYEVIYRAVPEFDYTGLTELDEKDFARLRQAACEAGGEISDIIEEIAPWAENCFKAGKIITLCGI